MKSAASQTQRLLESMGKLPVPPDDPESAARRRDRVVAHVSSVLEKEQRASKRRRWRPLVAALLAAAAVVLAVGGLRSIRRHQELATATLPAPAARARALEGAVLLARRGELSPVAMDWETLLESGDELRTAALGGATVVFSTGIVVNVGPATTFSVGSVRTEPGGRDAVVLTMGRVDVAVPKLEDGHSFAVRTPDAEVIVHGTRFSVTVASPSQGAPVITSVQVTEGRVSVVHAAEQSSLGRGETWVSGALPAVMQPASDGALPGGTSSGQRFEPSPSARPPAGARPDKALPQSSLADENRLFQSAMEAKRRGDDRSVVSTLDVLLTRYPSSPLAPDARVERFRALKRLGEQSAAAREARRYLAENPDGFARDEARDTILAPAPSGSMPSR